MELRHLRYFLAIAETENIHRAAEMLHIAQPAVSRQLQTLEQELGVALFERLPRGLRLTAAGRTYRDDIMHLMDQLGIANDRARRVAAGKEGLLRLGYIEIAASLGAVPELLQRFAREVPDVRVELSPAHTPRQLDMIAAGEIDGGFGYGMAPVGPDLAAHEIRTDTVLLAVPASWNDRLPSDPVQLADLTGLPFISFARRENPDYHDRLLAACKAGGLTPDILHEEPNEAAVLTLVAAGIGVALVNALNTVRPPPLVQFRQIANLDLRLPLRFVHRQDNANPALAAFLRLLEAGP